MCVFHQRATLLFFKTCTSDVTRYCIANYGKLLKSFGWRTVTDFWINLILVICIETFVGSGCFCLWTTPLNRYSIRCSYYHRLHKWTSNSLSGALRGTRISDNDTKVAIVQRAVHFIRCNSSGNNIRNEKRIIRIWMIVVASEEISSNTQFPVAIMKERPFFLLVDWRVGFAASS